MEPTELVESIDIINKAIGVIIKAWNKICYYWNRIVKSSVKVAVFGDSGVGKSQFLNTITKNNRYLTRRTRRNVKLKLTLKSGRVVEFLDTPGHSSSKPIREVVFEKIRKGKIKGIINIVNYGYQDGEDLTPQQAFNVDSKEVKPSYLRANRAREVSSAKEFIDSSKLTMPSEVKWILVVVNKADIWHQRKNEVMAYYESGTYCKVMECIPTSVKRRAQPFCSVISP